MELRRYLAILIKWFWLVAACVVVAAASAYLATRSVPRVYQAYATVRIGQALEKANPSYQEFYTSEQLAQTYAELVKRRPILEAAAAALNLDYIPSPGNISARRVPNTQLLELAVRHTNPQMAKRMVDELANQLVLQSPAASETVEQERGFILAQIEDLKQRITATKSEIQEEQAKLDSTSSARAIQQYRTTIAGLDQKLLSYQANYAALMQSLQSGSVNYVSFVEPAQLPTHPVSPNVRMNVLMAAVIGAALAVGAAFLLEYMDDTVKSPEDVERAMGLTTLGVISRIADVEGPVDALVTSDMAQSPISEAYRLLRTNLQFTGVGKAASTLMVTSSEASEGKTTTLANLGVVLAQAGKRVILVDTDLRRPSLHKLFGLDNSLGLTNLLVDDDLTLEDVALATSLPSLRLVSSGPKPPNPAELLELDRLGQIIEMFRQEADIVLFDAPPVLAVADASIMASKVDGVLMVVEMGRTRTEICRRAVEGLHQANAHLLGVVMNKVSGGRGGYYYTYYHYYYEDGDGQGRRRRRQERGLLDGLLKPWRRHARHRRVSSEAPSPPVQQGDAAS